MSNENLEQRMQRAEELSIRLVEVARIHQDSLGILQQRMDQMQSEIKGLQVTANRILERLDQHLSDGHGG